MKEIDYLKRDYERLDAIANSDELLDAAVAERAEKLLVEIDRLKRDLAGARAESSRWYEAFLLAVRERDLAIKELRAVR